MEIGSHLRYLYSYAYVPRYLDTHVQTGSPLGRMGPVCFFTAPGLVARYLSKHVPTSYICSRYLLGYVRSGERTVIRGSQVRIGSYLSRYFRSALRSTEYSLRSQGKFPTRAPCKNTCCEPKHQPSLRLHEPTRCLLAQPFDIHHAQIVSRSAGIASSLIRQTRPFRLLSDLPNSSPLYRFNKHSLLRSKSLQVGSTRPFCPRLYFASWPRLLGLQRSQQEASITDRQNTNSLSKAPRSHPQTPPYRITLVSHRGLLPLSTRRVYAAPGAPRNPSCYLTTVCRQSMICLR